MKTLIIVAKVGIIIIFLSLLVHYFLAKFIKNDPRFAMPSFFMRSYNKGNFWSQKNENENENITFCGFLTFRLTGWSGNLMTQIAAAIGLSLATKRKVILHESAKYLTNAFPNLLKYVSFNNSMIKSEKFDEIESNKNLSCHFNAMIKQHTVIDLIIKLKENIRK